MHANRLHSFEIMSPNLSHFNSNHSIQLNSLKHLTCCLWEHVRIPDFVILDIQCRDGCIHQVEQVFDTSTLSKENN